ncbi:MAG: TIGR04211 family SH3 domain-containing protein [Desulfobacterales bacterium]|nr:TIGR04211 family SH3 domain-containing protein [Desulfobacterales bacterium]
MKKFTLFLLLLFILPALLYAEQKYVGDINITLRSGPGWDTENKTIKELSPGQIVETIEKNDGWAYVRLPDGGEGWVYNRYLTSEKPSVIRLKSLEKKYEALLSEAESLRDENKTLKHEAGETELTPDFNVPTDSDVSTDSNEDQSAYDTLRKEYDALLAQAESLQEKNGKLKQENMTLNRGAGGSEHVLADIQVCYEILKKYSTDKTEPEPETGNIFQRWLNNKNILWYLIGICIFLFLSGLIIGKNMTRQRRKW